MEEEQKLQERYGSIEDLEERAFKVLITCLCKIKIHMLYSGGKILSR